MSEDRTDSLSATVRGLLILNALAAAELRASRAMTR